VSLDDGLPEIVNLDSYIRIVKEKSLLRQTIFGCQKIIDQCLLASEPSREILETGANLLEQLRARVTPRTISGSLQGMSSARESMQCASRARVLPLG
jgi:replicative DNA helicase